MPTPVSNDRPTDLADFTPADEAEAASSADTADANVCGAAPEPSTADPRDEVVDHQGPSWSAASGDAWGSPAPMFEAASEPQASKSEAEEKMEADAPRAAEALMGEKSSGGTTLESVSRFEGLATVGVPVGGQSVRP